MGRYRSESRYWLHVRLTGIEPAIWRTMAVPGAISLHVLHKLLQVVTGWENAHVYVCRLSINEKTALFALPDPIGECAGGYAHQGEPTNQAQCHGLGRVVEIDLRI